MDIKKLTQEVLLKNMTPEQQMAVLESVSASVKEAKAVQKQKIAENVDLVLQALKRIEADMLQRINGTAKVVEDRVKTIKDGKDGKNGVDGKAGRDGKDGKNGADGRDGKDGINGVSGERGQDGVGVQNAHIDFDGSLIISLTNGQELNVGEVVPFDVAEKIRIIGNGGGTSQFVLDTLASLQAAIDSITVPSQTGNAGKYLGTTGSALQWETFPDLTITDTFVVNTEAAMLALSAQKGDVAVRTDLNKTFILTASPATTLGNWQELLTPTDLVTSVAGRTGNVTLSNTDISGLGTMSTQNASSVAITGGTIDGTTVGATTAAAVTGTTVTAATTVVSPYFDAANSAGGALRNASGTPQLQWGGGGGNNITFDVAANLNPANSQIDISPTGTGTVRINPATVSSMDNVVIGATTAKAITGTTITATTYAGGNVANWDTAYGWGNHASAGYVVSGGALGTPSSGTLTNCTFPTLNQNTTGTAASTPKLLSTNFTIEESGGKLLFKYGATTIASMSSTGVITSATNIVSNGTP